MGAYGAALARALAGEGKNREALQHAQLSLHAYEASDTKLTAAKKTGTGMRTLIRQLQAAPH